MSLCSTLKQRGWGGGGVGGGWREIQEAVCRCLFGGGPLAQPFIRWPRHPLGLLCGPAGVGLKHCTHPLLGGAFILN